MLFILGNRLQLPNVAQRYSLIHVSSIPPRLALQGARGRQRISHKAAKRKPSLGAAGTSPDTGILALSTNARAC